MISLKKYRYFLDEVLHRRGDIVILVEIFDIIFIMSILGPEKSFQAGAMRFIRAGNCHFGQTMYHSRSGK